jgi:protein-tyrosine phosphatase
MQDPSRRTPVRLLFVCLGNICRSPTGEGVMRALVRDAGLSDRIEVASAGTSGWHIGEPPDPRSTATAAARGIVIDGAGAQVTAADFERFDLLLAMDRQNLRDLQALAPDSEARSRARLLRDWDPDGTGDVPDPYAGGPRGFEEVLDIVQRSCAALLDDLR